MGGRASWDYKSPALSPPVQALLPFGSLCLTPVNTLHHGKQLLESKGASCLINCAWHLRHKPAKSSGTGPAFLCAPQWAFPFSSVRIDASTIHVLNVLLMQNISFYHRENAVWKLSSFEGFLSQIQPALSVSQQVRLQQTWWGCWSHGEAIKGMGNLTFWWVSHLRLS